MARQDTHMSLNWVALPRASPHRPSLLPMRAVPAHMFMFITDSWKAPASPALLPDTTMKKNLPAATLTLQTGSQVGRQQGRRWTCQASKWGGKCQLATASGVLWGCSCSTALLKCPAQPALNSACGAHALLTWLGCRRFRKPQGFQECPAPLTRPGW